MNRILFTPFLIALAVMSACSSSPSREDVEKEAMRIDEMREEARQKRMEVENEKLQSKLDEVPEWFLDTPASDGIGVFGVGHGVSTRLDNALKIAQLQSEYDVARQLKQEISGQERDYNKQTGESDIVYQYSQLIDKLVTRVPVVGFDVVKKDVQVMDGKYHAYTLIKLPFREFNKVMQQESAQNQDATVKAAFDALEERVKAREAERKAEANPSVQPLAQPQSVEPVSQTTLGGNLTLNQSIVTPE